jgi:hypothetical protein
LIYAPIGVTAFGVEPGDSIAAPRTAGIGALQPVAEDTAYGRRCPKADLAATKPLR